MVDQAPLFQWRELAPPSSPLPETEANALGSLVRSIQDLSYTHYCDALK